jgi:hypothetical protein
MTACEEAMLASADVELLEDHLGEEIAAQEVVLQRLEEQERLLVANDVPGLRAFLAGSDPVLARLQALTEMRLRIMSLLGKRLGIPVDSCTVTRVLEAAESEDRARLAGQAVKLKAILKDVSKRTRRVNVLLRHASDTTQALIHALLGGPAPVRLYGPDGQRSAPSGVPHFARDV